MASSMRFRNLVNIMRMNVSQSLLATLHHLSPSDAFLFILAY